MINLNFTATAVGTTSITFSGVSFHKGEAGFPQLPTIFTNPTHTITINPVSVAPTTPTVTTVTTVTTTPTTPTVTIATRELGTLPGLTENQLAVARSLDALCARLTAIENNNERALSAEEQDLLTQCRTLQETAAIDVGTAIQGVAALTPDQVAVPRRMASQVAGAQLDNIENRLSALRRGMRGLCLNDLTLDIAGHSVRAGDLARVLRRSEDEDGACIDTGSERLGAFVSGSFTWGSKDETTNEKGFGFQTLGITAGVDYRFQDDLVLGIALGYGNSDVHIDASDGQLDIQAWTGLLYGTWYAADRFHLEGSVSYGRDGFDQTRDIYYSLLGETRRAKADYDGTRYSVLLGAGYDVLSGAGTLNLYGRVRYQQATIDGYRERGVRGLALAIDSQQNHSFRSILGVDYTDSFQLGKVALVPQGWFEWVHEFNRGDEQVTGSFAYDPDHTSFALATDGFDSDFYRAGLGLGVQLGPNSLAFVSYEVTLGQRDYKEHTATLGVRLEF